MIKTSDVIEFLPLEFASWLECHSFFSNIPVVVLEVGNIATELAAKQSVMTIKNGKRGAAVVIPQLLADDLYPNLAFGPMKLRPAFFVYEVPELNHDANGTLKSARRIAREIVKVVKPLRLIGLATDMVPDSPAIEPLNIPKVEGEKKFVGYQVNFTCEEADDEPLSQVATPLFEKNPLDSTQLVMTCDTPGAQIWFTTDDTLPVPTDKKPSSTATLYSTPVQVPEFGFTVRALAVKEGAVASSPNRAGVTLTEITNER